MTNHSKIAGYVVMAMKKGSKPGEWMQPMAYGGDGEMWPDELLTHRGVTLFQNADQAKEALTRTLRNADEHGSSWQKLFQYLILSVRHA